MMIFWDDAFEPPARPAEPTRARDGEPASTPSPPDPEPVPEEERQPPGRIWHTPRFAAPQEYGRRVLLLLEAASLAWLFLVALYLR